MIAILRFLFMYDNLCISESRLDQWKNSAVMVSDRCGSCRRITNSTSNLEYPRPSGSISILLYAAIAYISLYLMKKKWLDVRTVRRVSELTADSTLSIME